MCCILIIFTIGGYFSLDPIFSPYLEKVYEISDAKIGLIYATNNIFSAAFCPVTSIIATKVQKYKFLLTIGLAMTGVSFFFLGPNPFLQRFDVDITLIVFGEIFLGIGSSFVIVPCVTLI